MHREIAHRQRRGSIAFHSSAFAELNEYFEKRPRRLSAVSRVPWVRVVRNSGDSILIYTGEISILSPELQTEDGDATGIDFFGSDVLVNMSIWKDVESLYNFVYKTVHSKIMSRRKEWFHRVEEAYTVLWWAAEAEIPSLDEAKSKLELLKSRGPTAAAFSFKQTYPSPEC